jgi:hypothetical protein
MLQRWNDEQKRWEIIAAYYRCLNANARFRRALADLFSTLQTMVGTDLASYRHLAQHPNIAAAEESVRAFCERWPLPPEAEERDVLFSYRVGLRTGEVALKPGHRFGFLPTPGPKVNVDYIPPMDGARAIVVQEHQPWIWPSTPLPFLYHPLYQSRAWLRARIKAVTQEIAKSIESQAAILEQEVRDAGWAPPPAHLRREGYIERVARCIYLRAVERVTWEQIADSEERAQATNAIVASGWGRTRPDDILVRKTSTGWAKLAGIPLPSEAGVSAGRKHTRGAAKLGRKGQGS